MIKMIITDLDNTLLHRDKSISEYTLSILKKCQAKGIKIAFATARSMQATSKYFNIFTPDVFIGYGGAVGFCGDKLIFRYDIPVKIAHELINRCLHIPQISVIHAINEKVAYTSKIDPANIEPSHYQWIDFSKYNNTSYLKISLVASTPSIVEQLASDYPMLDMLRYSGEDFYRFANCNAVKENAVKAVSEFYDISPDAIIAFGDDKNDTGMLNYCGIGVAVKNAIDEVKMVAQYICDTNNNDGVAKWIERNILWQYD